MSDPKLTSYVLGELDGAELREFENLLQSSPEIRREVEKIRQMTKRLREELGTPSPTPAARVGRWWLAGALGLILGVGLAQHFFWPAGPDVAASRSAHVQLDPPATTNIELAQKNWRLVLETETLVISDGLKHVPVREMLTSALMSVQHCYEVRVGVPKSRVTGRSQWKIINGRAEQVSAEGADSVLNECMQKSVSRLKFPKGVVGQITLPVTIHF